MVLGWCRAGVGPKPIAIDRLTADNLAEALQVMARPEVKAAAQVICDKIKQVTHNRSPCMH